MSQVSPKSVPTPDWRVLVPNNFQCMSTNKRNKNVLIVDVQVCLVSVVTMSCICIIDLKVCLEQTERKKHLYVLNIYSF